MTVVIGGLGVVALAAFVLLQGGPATADTANLLTPGVPTPVALADGRNERPLPAHDAGEDERYGY